MTKTALNNQITSDFINAIGNKQQIKTSTVYYADSKTGELIKYATYTADIAPLVADDLNKNSTSQYIAILD